tara:strand:+ start:53 stop:577 length:525 start_codon:yes stop_codon:yes gene_type:complete
MKKIIQIFIAATVLTSCVSVKTKMNNSLEAVHTGMTITDFKNKVRGTTLVEMKDNYACYKLEKQSAKFGEPGGYVYETRFFYFKDDKLYRIDEGTRATDLKIEIAKDITNHTDSKEKENTSQYIDVVYLKNGSIIKGMIIEQIPNISLKIQTVGGSIFVYKMEDVEKMTKELSK